jgi:hypothetical protein
VRAGLLGRRRDVATPASVAGPFAAEVLVGFAVTSRNRDKPCAAICDGLCVTSGGRVVLQTAAKR